MENPGQIHSAYARGDGIVEQAIGVFNEKGIDAFRHYLCILVDEPVLQPPWKHLTDPACCVRLSNDLEIDQMVFSTRLEAAQYLTEVLSRLQPSAVEQNIGLWSWLSLFYFDQVCPPDAFGNRNPGREYRHILDKGYRNRHRHLLSGPYQAYRLYGKRAMLFLCTPLHKENKFHHELAGRQIFMSNPAIIDAAHELYMDKDADKPKPGAQAGGKPGTLRRFVNVVQQIDLTYDLYSMTSGDLISLLPSEFDVWKR